MTKRLLIAVFAVGLMAPLPGTSMASIAAAQERTSPAPTPPPPPPAPPAAPARPPAPPNAPPAPPQAPPPPQPGVQMNTNVQLDVVITDTVSGKPETKTVTLLVRNGRSGSIRTEGMVWPAGNAPTEVVLALDGVINIVGPQLVEARVTFNYAAPPQAPIGPTQDTPQRPNVPARVTENINATLRSGRPMLVSRSADPVTNRTVTVEMTATIREP